MNLASNMKVLTKKIIKEQQEKERQKKIEEIEEIKKRIDIEEDYKNVLVLIKAEVLIGQYNIKIYWSNTKESEIICNMIEKKLKTDGFKVENSIEYSELSEKNNNFFLQIVLTISWN